LGDVDRSPPHARGRLFVWLAGVDRVGLPRAQGGVQASGTRFEDADPQGLPPARVHRPPVPAGDHGPMRPRRISVVRQGWNWQRRRRSPACMAASTSPSTTTTGSPSASALDRRSTNACASGARTTSRAVLDHRNSWRREPGQPREGLRFHTKAPSSGSPETRHYRHGGHAWIRFVALPCGPLCLEWTCFIRSNR
jgi:hypothetical protein